MLTKVVFCLIWIGLLQSVNSHESNPTIRGALPFIAPEVFHPRKFTQKSDTYFFGIIMHLIATGEAPFRDRQFDRGLICDIMGGLRPSMPDPDKRPDAWRLRCDIYELIYDVISSDNNTWNAIY